MFFPLDNVIKTHYTYLKRMEEYIMLIGFSVSNYKSFYQRQTISFVASKIMRHKNHIISSGNRKILKTGLLFGANAGGKSNLIKAISFSRKIILNGLDNVDLVKRYFRISEDAYKEPAVFDYRLMIDDIEYSYGLVISYEKKEILSEWLAKITTSGEEKIIYNRTIDENGLSHVETNINMTSAEKNRMSIYLDDFGENISPTFRKKTILSDLALRGNSTDGIFSELLKVYTWFRNIIILFPNTRFIALNEVPTNIGRKSFFSKMIRFFDTGIESIEGKKQEMDFDKFLSDLPKEVAEQVKIDILNGLERNPKQGIKIKINGQMFILRKGEHDSIVYNKIMLNHGNAKDLFEYSDESDGTKRLFDLLPLLSSENLSRVPSVILVDEIDRSFHSNLSKRFLKLFYQEMQASKMQLIATTHDINLLDLDLLRQDEIWFVERQFDHSSKIFSLNKFKERFDKKVDKEYLLGRYGAIPIFDEEDLTVDE